MRVTTIRIDEKLERAIRQAQAKGESFGAAIRRLLEKALDHKDQQLHVDLHSGS